jgi:hypothetical protein
VEGVFEEAESGESDMSEVQKDMNFLLEAEPNKPSPMITGVDSEFVSTKVDRVFKFYHKSFKSKSHCETCTTEPVTILKTADFAVGTKGYLNEFQKDLDFACPEGEAVMAVKSEFICKSTWCDLKWNARCGKVAGATLGSCTKALPKSCSTLPADAEYTPAEAGWHMECPRHGVLTEIKSVYEVNGPHGDRKYEFKCCELSEIGGYKDYAAGYIKGSGDAALWTFDAGNNTAITGISSGYTAAESQRTFTFYATTFEGKKDCSTEWTPGR